MGEKDESYSSAVACNVLTKAHPRVIIEKDTGRSSRHKEDIILKNVKFIVAVMLALILLLPATALAEADTARFEALVAANSMQARFDRHGSVQLVKRMYFEDGTIETETYIMDPMSHYFISTDGYSYYIRPDLYIWIYPGEPTEIFQYFFDSEEAQRKNFSDSFIGWSLSADGEELLESHEADGVFTARTKSTDPASINDAMAQYKNTPESYKNGKDIGMVFFYTFDAETGDLLKVSGDLVDAEGNAYTLCEDVLTYDVQFDPAAEDSPFATYFAAPEGMVALTLHFVDDGTEMKYTLPHGTNFIIGHGDQSVATFLDEACTQPYEGKNELDELTLYVK